MKKSFKNSLRDWLPPAIIRWIIKIKGIGNSFEGDYANWQEASVKCSGYNAEEILDKVLAATLKVKMVMLFLSVTLYSLIMLNILGL